jgi:hypothetical protein
LLSDIGFSRADDTTVSTAPGINDAIDPTFNLPQTSDSQLAVLATVIRPFDYSTAKDLYGTPKVDPVLG